MDFKSELSSFAENFSADLEAFFEHTKKNMGRAMSGIFTI